MAGNLALLRGASAGATISPDRITYGADSNGRFYQTDISGLVLYQSVRQVLPFASSTGNTVFTFGENANDLTAVLTVTGGAGTRNVAIDTVGRIVNDKIDVRINSGSTAGVIINLRNATVGGSIFSTFTTDGSGTDNALWSFYFDGTAWQSLGLIYPTL